MTDRRYRDAGWLREQYVERERTQAEIANMCGCTATTVRNWLHKDDIETREGSPTPDKRLKDEDWLREQYVERERPATDIADACGCGATTVRRWMDKHKIETRGPGPAVPDGRLKDENWLREQYIKRGRKTADIADVCECDTSTVRRWLHKHDFRIREPDRVADARLKDAQWLREQYVERGRSTADIASECACHPTTVSRWLKKHGIETQRDGPQPGEKHPRWNGGTFPYGPGWTERKRRRVRKRDGYRCVRCGTTQEEHKERHDQKLHVHHLTKARQLDDPEKRNAMSNLVTVCRDCHDKWERVAAAGLRPQLTGIMKNDTD